MDDWILDSDFEPETVEFSDDELETLEMAIEFFLDGYCEEQQEKRKGYNYQEKKYVLRRSG